MKLKIMGINFPHQKGVFCQKTSYTHYTICCFVTPFLYLKDGTLCKGNAGDILINTPGTVVYHGPQPNSKIGFINDWMHIEGDDLRDLLEKYPLPLNTAFSVGQEHFLRKYMNRVYSEYSSGKIGSEDMISCIVMQMVVDLHRVIAKESILQGDHYGINNVRRMVIKHPEKKWTIEDAAKLSGYSSSRFCELYRKFYDISFINDVLAHRIQHAKKLLESGQASVSYVAEACGFRTINYFSKYFRKITGYSPKEYMRQFQN